MGLRPGAEQFRSDYSPRLMPSSTIASIKAKFQLVVLKNSSIKRNHIISRPSRVKPERKPVKRRRKVLAEYVVGDCVVSVAAGVVLPVNFIL